MTGKNPEELYAMRHSLAHIMATAIQKLYPNAKFGIGPPVEDGFYYDVDLGQQHLREADLVKIEAEMRKIIKADQKFEHIEMPLEEALAWAKSNHQDYKLQLLEDLAKHGTTNAKDIDASTLGTADANKVSKVSFYKNGEFTDLCQGPHVVSTGKVGAFKLHRLAGAYWRGNEKNSMLQRVYGLAFGTDKELEEYEKMLEEAAKRDHRILGERLDLFTLSPEVGAGLILWLPRGTIIKDELEKLGKRTEKRYGYQRVSTPHIAKEGLFHTSGHLPYYRDDMYPPMKMENDTYYLKPMNCPLMHMVYQARKHSYRELPLRYAEFGTVYRNEDSGTLMGLLRVRGQTQNDAHIYCSQEQALDELLAVMELHKFYYSLFGITDYYIELALPDFKNKKDKYFDDPKGWEKAVAILRQAAKKSEITVVEKAGEAAFYGPKFDFNIKSAIGREFGASTSQLDFGSGKRFGLTYADKDGKEKEVPYIIHRAPLGSDERFIGFLIEHYGGAFPVWLAPEQVRLATVNDSKEITEFAQQLKFTMIEAGLRVELDISNESVSKKIREAEIMKVPYTVVIGQEELKTGKLKPRVRTDIAVKHDAKPLGIEQFIQTAANEAKSYVRYSSL